MINSERVTSEFDPSLSRRGLDFRILFSDRIRLWISCVPLENVYEHTRTERLISLLGIESPGLTSSLAIAEKVVGMLQGIDEA